MKLITVILSLLILTSLIKPCSDRSNFKDQHENEITTKHNHQNDNDDTCPITCACNCCGIAITCEPIQTFEIGFNNQISTKNSSVYLSIYRFNFHSNIWQPPQLIS